MTDLVFSEAELLAQARGNQTAIWHLAVRRARERDGSVDEWGSYVGREFAPSWEEMGEAPSARDVARMAALNVATTADMQPVRLDGDDTRAELLIEGPEQEWLDDFGTTLEDLDRVNELIFRAIAEGRGLTLDSRRADDGLHLVFERPS